HRWYVLVNEKCRKLDRNNLCSDYEQRPEICRVFSNDECEYWGDYYDTLFENEKELTAYLEQKGFPEKKKPKKKSRKRTVKTV
ncbi:MAG: YkgJ family cysteine cluster protein, partial [Nitrospinota bacterium]